MKSFNQWLNEKLITVNGVQYDTDNIIDHEELKGIIDRNPTKHKELSSQIGINNNIANVGTGGNSGMATTVKPSQPIQPINLSTQNTIIKQRMPSLGRDNPGPNWNPKTRPLG